MTLDVPALESIIKPAEGLRLKVYKDSRGFNTIGWCRNLDSNGISVEEAQLLLDNDIKKLGPWLERLPVYQELSPARQLVIAEMLFNMGYGKLSEFHNMFAALKAQNWDRAAEEMLDSLWHRQVGARANRLADAMKEG